MTVRHLEGLVGVIGDVHAEDARLGEALEHLHERGARTLLCTGDVPDGIGSVSACAELLARYGVVTVRGNHERWFLGSTMRELPDATSLEEVTPSARAYLAALAPTHAFTSPLGPVLLCHGLGETDMAKVGPEDEGYALESNDALQRLVRERRYRLVLNGHSHRAMVRRFGELTVVNAGTLKRDHDPGFVLVDLERARVHQFRWEGDPGKIMEFQILPLV